MVIFHSYVSLPEGMLTTSKEMFVALSLPFKQTIRPTIDNTCFKWQLKYV